METLSKGKKAGILRIYLIFLYSIWAIYELTVKEILDSTISNILLCRLLQHGIIKNILWTLPAFLLIRYYESDVFVTMKKMVFTKVNWLKYMPVFTVFTIYILLASLLQNGKIAVASDFGIDDIIVVLFVGLTEEMVFRGWLLNITVQEDKKWVSIIVNAALFLAIHFPIWIHDGVFVSRFTSFGFMTILVLSVIFSWTFIKSRSILVPITLHMYWDLMVFMFA